MKEVYIVSKWVEKLNTWTDFGRLPVEDIKEVTKGYKREEASDKNEGFLNEWLQALNTDEFAGIYTRKGSRDYFHVEEV